MASLARGIWGAATAWGSEFSVRRLAFGLRLIGARARITACDRSGDRSFDLRCRPQRSRRKRAGARGSRSPAVSRFAGTRGVSWRPTGRARRHAEMQRSRAPFDVPAPWAATSREQTLAPLLACYGISSPPRLEPARRGQVPPRSSVRSSSHREKAPQPGVRLVLGSGRGCPSVHQCHAKTAEKGRDRSLDPRAPRTRGAAGQRATAQAIAER